MKLQARRLIKKVRERGSPTTTNGERAGDESGPSQHDRIAACAYALYEQRDKRDKHDLDDWLKAERRIAGSDS